MLLETIKCKDGRLFNMEFHQDRLNEAHEKLFPESSPLILSELLQVPEQYQKGLYRCRVLYAETIEKVEFLLHRFRVTESLMLVEDSSIDYALKYADRAQLKALFEKRAGCDDILIVKNDCITDSYTANPIFFDGKTWWAPDTPLLEGTQRAKLLSEGRISQCRIRVSDLPGFEKVGLINALQDMDDMPVVSIENIQGL